MKTKSLILLPFLFLLIPSVLQAQDCYIIMKIKGTIVLESTGQILQKDDQICGDDKVIFKTSNAAALVHSSTKGRYTLKANKSRMGELEGVLVSAVSTALSKKTATLDTKSLEIPVREEFDVVYCLINEFELILDNGEYPFSDENYFMLRFKYKDTTYEIKLTNNNNIVYLNKQSILEQIEYDGETKLIEDAALYYYNIQSKDNLQIIDAFDISIPDEKTLANELSNFKVLLKNSGRSEDVIKEDLIVYMYNAYGTVSKNSFLKWLNENVK